MANQNKIGIVTGGSKGIGQSISIGLSQKNIDVIITYLRDKDGALTTSNEIKKTGANCHICLLYTSPSPRDRTRSRMPSSA